MCSIEKDSHQQQMFLSQIFEMFVSTQMLLVEHSFPNTWNEPVSGPAYRLGRGWILIWRGRGLILVPPILNLMRNEEQYKVPALLDNFQGREEGRA